MAKMAIHRMTWFSLWPDQARGMLQGRTRNWVNGMRLLIYERQSKQYTHRLRALQASDILLLRRPKWKRKSALH